MRQVKGFAAGDDSALKLIRIQQSEYESIGVCSEKWRHLLPEEPIAVGNKPIKIENISTQFERN